MSLERLYRRLSSPVGHNSFSEAVPLKEITEPTSRSMTHLMISDERFAQLCREHEVSEEERQSRILPGCLPK